MGLEGKKKRNVWRGNEWSREGWGFIKYFASNFMKMPTIQLVAIPLKLNPRITKTSIDVTVEKISYYLSSD